MNCDIMLHHNVDSKQINFFFPKNASVVLNIKNEIQHTVHVKVRVSIHNSNHTVESSRFLYVNAATSIQNSKEKKTVSECLMFYKRVMLEQTDHIRHLNRHHFLFHDHRMSQYRLFKTIECHSKRSNINFILKKLNKIIM